MRKKIDKKEIAKEICKAAKLYKTSFLQEVRICVVCIQCLIYMIDTPFDKRNLAELMTFFLNKPLFRPHESQAFRDLL